MRRCCADGGGGTIVVAGVLLKILARLGLELGLGAGYVDAAMWDVDDERW